MNSIYEDLKTLPIMYIGPKAVKRDTVSGFRPQMSFVRNEPTDAPLPVAIALLDFPDCFIRATKENIKQAEEAEKRRIKAAEEAARLEEERKLKEAADNDMTVEVDGSVIDLSRYNSRQLAAFVEGNGLDLMQDPKELVRDFCRRVRDTYRETMASIEETEAGE